MNISTESILSYQNDAVVNRFCKEHGYSKEDGLVIFAELKKFLTLAVVDTEVQYSPSKAQDAMWHEFIMYTKDYIKFCEDFLGRFVHHVPCEGNQKITNGCSAKKRAVELFGQIVPKYWPNKSITMRCCSYC